MFINKDKSRRSSRRGIQAKEIHNFVVKRSASKGQDEGNHFLKGKLPVPGIVFAGSCGEEPFVVCHSLNCIFQCFFTVFGFTSKPPCSLACRDTLLTTKAILLTEVSKMAARNDAFVKPCFELLRKKPPTLSFLRVGGFVSLTY